MHRSHILMDATTTGNQSQPKRSIYELFPNSVHFRDIGISQTKHSNKEIKMLSLPITSITAALLAIIMLPLTVQVSAKRLALGKAAGDVNAVLYGDGGDAVLLRRIRAFGTFIEYVPFCLIMLALTEGAGASSVLVWAIGGTLLVSRIVHALAILYTKHPAPRRTAMFMTYASILVPSVWLLFHYLA
jgi:uncharacterized protein